MISAEQFAEWKNDPVTKEVYNAVKEAKQSLLEKVGDGQTIGHAADVTHGLTNNVVGQIRGLNQLLNMTFADDEPEQEVNEVSGY